MFVHMGPKECSAKDTIVRVCSTVGISCVIFPDFPGLGLKLGLFHSVIQILIEEIDISIGLKS